MVAMWWLLVAQIVQAFAAPDAHRVEKLPGWNGSLPSPWYSGYLSFGKKHLHYVLVEAESGADKAPVVLWLNGGPGCSSMDGLFYEHGQLLVNEDGTKLIRNPHAWTQVATVLYLEAPVGVGYSYSEDEEDLRNLDDNVTATDNLKALKAFFTLFPEFKSRDFYLSGESYAGIYIPTLAAKIASDSSGGWNMKGLIVGNGIFSYGLLAQSSVLFLAGHGALSPWFQKKLDEECHGEYRKGTTDCLRLVVNATKAAEGLNPYDYYRDCYQEGGHRKFYTGLEISRNVDLLRDLVQAPRPAHPALVEGGGPVCVNGDGATKYLNKPEVRSALHIAASLPAWEICVTSPQWFYSRNYSYYAPEYYAELKDKFKILIFHGDTDMACDYISGAMGVELLNVSVDPTMDWVPWRVEKEHIGSQVAGFITKYTTGPGLYFATVKGAGHMVPQWRPQESYELLERFLHGKLSSNGQEDVHIVV